MSDLPKLEFNVNPLTPQAQLVLDYLSSGRELTPLIAMVNLGVASLTARIAELRRHGLEVYDKWSEDHFKKRYKKYWMEKRREADGQ